VTSNRLRVLLVGLVVLAMVGGFAALNRSNVVADATEIPPGPTAAIDTQGAVLLIPGYGGGSELLTPALTRLRQWGMDVEVVDIDDGSGDLNDYARLVIQRANELVSQGAPSVDLVGFSAGGVIARLAATSPQGQPLVRKVVTVATPHNGTRLAALGRAVGQCPPACQQLNPGSELLDGLPDASATDRYLTLWTRSDDVVRPPESARLPGASELVVQDVCDRVVGHRELYSDRVTLASVPAFLAGAALPTTCPA
jgi:triacylglycerol esterase/lipase EstA (alpha/beta hydrolase family)